MIHLFFLIRSLERGGAERQLTELVKGLDKTRFTVTVASFYDGGALRSEIEGTEGVKVLSLHKKNRWDVMPFLWRLLLAVREEKPQIVHSYMGVANELGLLAARVVGARAVWGLRNSYLDLSRYDWATASSYRVGAWLSRFADLIIVNSHAGAREDSAHGYCRERMVVIPNGIDIKRFKPDDEAGHAIRRQWNIGENEQVIGLVGRLDPQKDHPTFLRAAALLAQERHDVRFVCVGGGPASYEQELQRLAEELGLGKRLIWAGTLSNMPAVHNAFDIATSSSGYGEGFGNVIGEAMACGVPCVVTDVGDSAMIVGDAGYVVPPKDPEALMEAWVRLLDLPDEQRAALAMKARERIVEEYNTQHLISKTESMLRSIL